MRGARHPRTAVADLRGDRAQALKRYRSSKTAVARAKQFLDKVYRGYQQDA